MATRRRRNRSPAVRRASLRELVRLYEELGALDAGNELTEIGRADGSSGAQGSAAGVFDPVIVPGCS